MLPANAKDPSLAATKARLQLAYGDLALVALQIVDCIEYELAERDKRIREQATVIREMQQWIASLERGGGPK